MRRPKQTPKQTSTKKQSNIASLSANQSTEKLYETLNNIELKKSMDYWLKTKEGKAAVIHRDLNILKGINEEYLNSFLLLGYTMEGERVIMQSYSTAQDKDALLEFLKTVFIQHHQPNTED